MLSCELQPYTSIAVACLNKEFLSVHVEGQQSLLNLIYLSLEPSNSETCKSANKNTSSAFCLWMTKEF